MSHRLNQIQELIKRELGQIIKKDFDCALGILITITEVIVDPELEQAKIMISVYPEDQRRKMMRELDKYVIDFQRQLNKRLKMRFVPKIFFRIDVRLKDADEVEKIMENLQNDDTGLVVK